MNLELSQHAWLRAQQRGVPHAVIDMVLDHADVCVSVGSGCTALRLSKRRLSDQDLRQDLQSDLDRAARITVVLSDDTGEVVTVMHDHGGREGRRYRRSH